MSADNASITVGVDGSQASVDALKYAAKLAEAMHAPLRVVTVWHYPALVPFVPPEEWKPEVEAASVLSLSIDRALGDGAGRLVTKDLLEGNTAKRLIEESDHSRMLVLGARGAGGFARLLLGSVCAACAAHAHCPVLLVRDSPAESHV